MHQKKEENCTWSFLEMQSPSNLLKTGNQSLLLSSRKSTFSPSFIQKKKQKLRQTLPILQSQLAAAKVWRKFDVTKLQPKQTASKLRYWLSIVLSRSDINEQNAKWLGTTSQAETALTTKSALSLLQRNTHHIFKVTLQLTDLGGTIVRYLEKRCKERRLFKRK